MTMMLLWLLLVQAPIDARPKLFIEDYVQTAGMTKCAFGVCRQYSFDENLTLNMTAWFAKGCPAIQVTSNRESADYVMKLSSRGSVIYRKDGSIAGTTIGVPKAKDSCAYLTNLAKSHPINVP
jgi:hypothetical protein